MEKKETVCRYCTEKHCCRGLCKEMNDYLVKQNEMNKKKVGV